MTRNGIGHRSDTSICSGTVTGAASVGDIQQEPGGHRAGPAKAGRRQRDVALSRSPAASFHSRCRQSGLRRRPVQSYLDDYILRQHLELGDVGASGGFSKRSFSSTSAVDTESIDGRRWSRSGGGPMLNAGAGTLIVSESICACAHSFWVPVKRSVTV
jgi:hypothetical protein